MPKIIVNGMHMGYVAPSRAQDVSYDNTTSGLSATDVKNALDEINEKFSTISYNDLTDKPSTVSKSSEGFCPALPNEDTTTKYLRQDGTWVVPPNTTYNVTSKTAAGLCPQLPNETTTAKFLRQDGSWVAPPNTTYSAGSNITLSGTTFSLTKANVTGALGYTPPTTNTTYSAGSNITLSGTTFSLTKANVTGALGYTPPTSDTNTVTSFTTKEFENTFSVGANSTASLYPTITNSGWTPLGVIGVYCGSEVCFCPYWKLNSGTQARIEIRNPSSTAVTNGKYRVQVLYYKNT